MNALLKALLSRANGMYQGWMNKRDLSCPEDVEMIPGDGMDIFRPKEPRGKLPVIVDLHGGGLVLCGREVNGPFCAALARRGFLVVNLDYPLVPQKDVPGILGDVCAGLDAVNELLDRLGGDRERIFLVGDSAGAFLAVYATAMQKSEAIAQAAGVRPTKLPIHGLGLISGMFHTADNDQTGVFLRSSFYGKDWRHHPLMPYLKPERAEIARLMPPCFLVTSKADSLRAQSLSFYKALKGEGVPCELLEFGGLPHDFVIMDPERPESRRAMDAMAHFLADPKTAIDKTANL